MPFQPRVLHGFEHETMEAKIRFLVIGGFAAIMHGIPLFTKDLDIAILPDLKTSEAILEVLRKLDFETAWERCEVAYVKATPVNLVCLDDLIALKYAAGRKIDLEDAEYPEKIRDGKI